MLSNSSPITELLKNCSVILLILAIGVEETATSKYMCIYIGKSLHNPLNYWT